MTLHRRAEQASALLIVFWAILLLSFAIFAWSQWIFQEVTLDADANRGLEATAMAHSGMTVALNARVPKYSPLLEHRFSQAQGYRVKMVSEGGKLNINWLLGPASPDHFEPDPAKIALLRHWLETRGLNFRERDILIDCLLDYMDPDNIPRANGVEDTDTYHAANRPFLSVEEIARVWGAEPLTRTPGWKDDLTIYSKGPIDLVAAPIEILRLIPGLGEAQIQNFVKYRAGPDGIDGTEDDPELKNAQEVYSLLGISPAALEQLQGLISVNDPTMHITSEGNSGNVTRRLEVVAQRNASNSQILFWKE